MKNNFSWLKWIGGVWLALGVLSMIWGAMSLFSTSLGATPPFRLADPARSFFSALHMYPWTEATALAIGIFWFVSGWGLILRRSWTQTVLVSAHTLLAVYALVGWVAAYALQGNSQTRWPLGPLVFLAAALLNGGVALLLNGLSITEALSWLPLQTVHIADARCELCGAQLDPQTGLCPRCQSVPDKIDTTASQPPPKAKLVNVENNALFWIDTTHKTMIGRGAMQNDINLNSPTVSRRHAWIEYKEGQFWLNAISDANGTFVNDERIQQQVLNNGDQIRFGRIRFQFLIS